MYFRTLIKFHLPLFFLPSIVPFSLRGSARFRTGRHHAGVADTSFAPQELTVLFPFTFAVGIFACRIAHRPRPTCAKIRLAIAIAILLSSFFFLLPLLLFRHYQRVDERMIGVEVHVGILRKIIDRYCVVPLLERQNYTV